MPGMHELLKNKPSPGAPGFVSDQLKGLPAPPIQKPYPEDAALIDLVPPQDFDFPNVNLIDAIKNRRTHRLFSNTPLSRQEISFMLWATQGIQHVVRGGQVTLRTVPSAGGMHPFETYLLAIRLEDTNPGLYRYLALEHKLLPLPSPENLTDRLVEACNGQDYVANGAVIFLWSAKPYRSEWRNAENAPKDILITAGHICQNLYLASEVIQAGVSPLITYQQELIDQLVGIDGEEEMVIYLATAGKIDTNVIML